MEISNFEIGMNTKPFIITEISESYDRSLDRTKEIIKAIAESMGYMQLNYKPVPQIP